jgi:GTP pyrophosphokinase
LKNEWLESVFKKYGFTSIDDVYSAVGLGAISPNKIVTKLKEEYKKSLKPDEIDPRLIEPNPKKTVERRKCSPHHGVVVKGVENCMVKLSRCCNPVPGDEIIGYITKGRGVSVHTKDCPNITSAIDGDNRLIEVLWHLSKDASYITDLTLTAHDRAALVFEVANIFADAKISIKGMNARTTKDLKAFINISLEISNTEQLEKLVNKLSKIDGVIEITRTRQ